MRYHTTTRPVFDDDGNQIGYEQINIPFTPDEEAEWDAMEAEAPTKELAAKRAAMQITARQCRLQLLAMSLLDDVEAAIDTMGASAKIEWEYALEVKRTYTLVAAMQQLFSWSDAEMDTFFTEAGKL